MRRIHDLQRWYQAESNFLLYPGEPDFYREVQLTVNVTGLAALYMVPYDTDGKGKVAFRLDDKVLLGVVGAGKPDTFAFGWGGDFAVQFEASGEVWVLRDQTPVAIPGPPDSPEFTRLEKAAMFMDELDIVLHRQSVLQRMSQRAELNERNEQDTQLRQRNEALEVQLRELAEKVAALAPPKGDSGGDHE